MRDRNPGTARSAAGAGAVPPPEPAPPALVPRSAGVDGAGGSDGPSGGFPNGSSDGSSDGSAGIRPGGVLKRERVRDAVLGMVEERRAGDAIPSERTLCVQLGVSRPTLRAAVDELVAAGVLIREHGRGVFVAPEKITQELVPGRHALGVPRASGAWASRLLEFTTVPAGARVGRRLRLSPAAQIVYVARLRLVDGYPMAIEHLHIPAALVPGLSSRELEFGDLYEHLRAHHDVHVNEATQTIEPTVVTRAEAELLEVPELSPALLFERLTTDTAGQPVEYVHSLYRGDRYRIVSHLTLRADAAPAAPADGHHPGIPPGDFAHGDPVAASTLGDVQGRR